ncbi:MAG TPA: glycosyltransferase family 4 protein [Usitatibacter sp.]|nr:glycosyltransferase family 4 protein [Usitatibacter sp.]
MDGVLTRAARRRIVMVGSALEVRGGVSAVAAVYRDAGLFERWDAVYLATHCDGGAHRKLARAARAWLAFAGMLLAARVALLHVHLNSGASFWRKALFAIPARALAVPYVLHVHCGRFDAFVRERCGLPGRALARWLLEGAAATIALSEPAAEELRRLAPAARVEVIPNPVRMPRAWGARAGAPTALFLGMVTEAKGIAELLHAWPDVMRAVPGARLVLAGAGDIAAARRLAERLGVAPSVSTPGWVGPAEKARLIAQASLLVLPSHAEALPMALLEAGAAGLPAVATPVGGIPSVVRQGETGLLVPPRSVAPLAAALIALLSDPARSRALGEAARLHVEANFSSKRIVPRIEAVWRRCAPAQERAARR